jgi:site-specific DNA-methyltransferase (adenine-specific)
MKFDVIVGNPPYQLSDGGAQASASPIYHKFVEQAKKMNPRYLTMIIPSRWFGGGKGLDEFRDAMLKDDHIRQIHDFPDASDVFPGVQIKSGVCYFLWDRDHKGSCKVFTYNRKECVSFMERPLLENGVDTFIRYNEGIEILKKVQNKNENTIREYISSRKPFGLPTTFQGNKKPFDNSVLIYQNGGIGYLSKYEIVTNSDMINKYKIFIPRASSGSDSFPHSILGRPFFGDKGTACSETYMVIGPFKSKKECENVITYISTRFFRFLVLLIKNTQDTPKKVYSFVPIQDFSEPWTDEKLYKKYGLTQDEIAFIESMIRPMEIEERC